MHAENRGSGVLLVQKDLRQKKLWCWGSRAGLGMLCVGDRTSPSGQGGGPSQEQMGTDIGSILK